MVFSVSILFVVLSIIHGLGNVAAHDVESNNVESFVFEYYGNPPSNPCKALFECFVYIAFPSNCTSTQDELLQNFENITNAECEDFLCVIGGQEAIDAVCNLANLFQTAAESPFVVEQQQQLHFGELQDADKVIRANYPLGAEYDAAVASIIGTFIKDGKESQMDDNAVGGFIIGLGAVRVAAAAV